MRVAVTLIILCLMISSCGKKDADTDVETTGPAIDRDFVKLYDDLNANKQTALYISEHWKQANGTQVNWTGIVVDVKTSRGQAIVYIAKPEKPRYRGFNVTLTVPDLERAGVLQKRQAIKFSGVLSSYNAHRGGVVVVNLISGDIL